MKKKTEAGRKGKSRMDINEIRAGIGKVTGIDPELLKGETAAEMVQQAKALLEFRGQFEKKAPKSKPDQFAEYMDQLQGIERRDETSAALDAIIERARIDSGGYPNPGTQDGGDPYINNKVQPDPRKTRDKFAEYAADCLSFDVFGGSWIKTE